MKSHTTDAVFSRSKPTPMAIPNPNCPILLEARELLDNTQDLHRAIRRLQRSTQRCLTCPERTSCPTVRYLAQAIDTAIRELHQEWGLDDDSNE
jgi:hypothetical protein